GARAVRAAPSWCSLPQPGLGRKVIAHLPAMPQCPAKPWSRSLGAATVGDLVQGLVGLKVDTRRIISILQALKSAGALHAELIVE
ncbi:flagellar basal body P-ring protein FlgI, partial [Novosphingobium sp.]|uniref:flagellar basal body P-ring protein FlgI n=1 Tax=Novosphingobium sp. TaxID=1874826 RepID=UPI0035B0E1BB